MTNASNGTAIFFAATTSLIFTACGGGDNGDDHGNTVILPTSGITITSSNAQRIGAAVVNSVGTLQGTTSGTGVFTTVSIPPQIGRINFRDFILQQLRVVPDLGPLPGDNVAGKILSETLSCPDGGNVNLSGEVADQNTLTVDDVINLSFSICDIDGYVSNGSVAITVTRVVGNDGKRPFTLGVDMVVNGLAVSYDGTTVTSDGDMAMFLDAGASGDDHVTFSGNAMTSTSSSGQVGLLTDYLCDIQVSDSTGEYSITPQGNLAATQIDGSVFFATTTPFTGNAFVGSGAPTAGQVHITTETDNSQAWLTAQPDGIHVMITTDRDGNGIEDEDGTITTTWADLQNSL